jgi:hypothetical protein
LSVLDEATPVGQISQSESSDARQVLWRRSTHPTKERKLPADAIVQPPLSFVRGVVLFGIGGFAVLAVVIASSHADVVHARAGFVDTGTAVRTELGGIESAWVSRRLLTLETRMEHGNEWWAA